MRGLTMTTIGGTDDPHPPARRRLQGALDAGLAAGEGWADGEVRKHLNPSFNLGAAGAIEPMRKLANAFVRRNPLVSTGH